MSPHDGDGDQQRAATAARGRVLERLAALAGELARDDLRYSGETSAQDVWWTRAEVLAYLDSAGTPLGAETWSGYVSRGQAPAPVRRIGRTPLWDSGAVRAWQAARRGRGWRAGTGGPSRDDRAGGG